MIRRDRLYPVELSGNFPEGYIQEGCNGDSVCFERAQIFSALNATNVALSSCLENGSCENFNTENTGPGMIVKIIFSPDFRG